MVDNGRVGGRVVRARAIREMNEISLRQLEANVSLELRRIGNNLRAIEQRWKSLSAAIASAEQNVNVVRAISPRVFPRSWNIATPKAAFWKPGAPLLSALYQQQLARAEWDRATGRYFQFSDDTAEKFALVAALKLPRSKKLIWIVRRRARCW